MATFSTILCPIDLDENASCALDFAERIAKRRDTKIVVLHVIPVVLNPGDARLSADLYKPRAEAARQKLLELARKHLDGSRYEVKAEMGHPATVIVDIAKQLPADLLVISTHGRKFSRLLLGSVVETVMREVECPVLTVKNSKSDRMSVGQWMTAHPVTAAPQDKPSVVQSLMLQGNFRSVPVLDDGTLVGIVTDRDLRSGSGDQSNIEEIMSRSVITVTSSTSIFEASRILSDRKIGSLPVVDDGQLVGIISTQDVLKAFVELR
ncbi:MAG: universal stress protein [Candidatus Binataceae bacterium]